MGYISKSKRKAYLLFGFIGMFFCGIGDILLAFRGEGEPYAIGGMMSINITDVPLWYYQLSFLIGIVAAIGYWLGSRSVYSYVLDRLAGKSSKLLSLYTFGANMMSLGIFGIHSVCSMAVMCLRAAAESGLSAEIIDEFFTLPVLIPFAVTTVWQTVADILVAIAYIGLVFKKIINISKLWIICGPICLYIIFGVFRVVLTYFLCNPLYGKLLSGGETWGLAFLFFSVFFCLIKQDRDKVEKNTCIL